MNSFPTVQLPKRACDYKMWKRSRYVNKDVTVIQYLNICFHEMSQCHFLDSLLYLSTCESIGTVNSLSIRLTIYWMARVLTWPESKSFVKMKSILFCRSFITTTVNMLWSGAKQRFTFIANGNSVLSIQQGHPLFPVIIQNKACSR